MFISPTPVRRSGSLRPTAQVRLNSERIAGKHPAEAIYLGVSET